MGNEIISNLKRHPFVVARMLAERFDNDIVFNFSKYVYEPQQLFDRRECFSINGADLAEELVKQWLKNLENNQELAFHSLVTIKGKKRHIPMMDFMCNEWSEKVWNQLRKYIHRKVLNELQVFASGRSFHGYSTYLLSPGDWPHFMGRQLLMNEPGLSDLIDARWVGHRLISGYCSLRWSCNTEFYRSVPKSINPVLQYPPYRDEAESVDIG